ncbi:TraX family protein [Streptococcus sp. E24BD]|uniref:TraX family protein n=1 Tax=Streptococcus sp. E24BD TaxID=3278715 RepID=UPI00359F109D
MPHTFKGFSAFSLRLIAMIIMLIDHTGAVFFPQFLWLRYIGRLAFPIFAFLIVEGYSYTKDFRRYLLRLSALAVISDFPFHLMLQGTWGYTPFQNVIWTFVISLITIWLVDQSRQILPKWGALASGILITAIAYNLAQFLDTDYRGLGVITVLGYYLFRGTTWSHRLGQLFALLLVNLGLANLSYLGANGWENLPLLFQHFGFSFLSPQLHAPLALAFIWLCNGRAGYKSKPTQIAQYLFYPIHMLILGILAFYVF